MVVKLSSFLSTSLAQGLDSATVTNIIDASVIPLDSGTSGPYLAGVIHGNGIIVTGSGSHEATATINVDSSKVAYLTSTQTLTNKTINLSNNTLVSTFNQINAAVSGETLVGIGATQTLTNKTLTSPTITGPTITGPASLTKISTFGLRDTTTTSYDTRFASTSTTALTQDRLLTFDIKNGDKTITLGGGLTLGGAFTTSGAHTTTLTTSGNTSVTLPTSGTLVSKDGSGNVTIAGTLTAGNLSGIYLGFDSDFGVAIAASSTTDLSEGTNLYYLKSRVDSDIDLRVNASFINTLSGVDADTLGGQAGSYYLNYNNFSNTPTIPTVYNSTIKVFAGSGISGSATFSINNPLDSDITITNTDKGSSQNIFKNIAVSGQSTIVADTNDDTLTLAAGAGVTLTTNATTDTVTIAASAAVPTGTTPPASPSSGALWWDDSAGDLYIYFQDSDTSQWVQASPSILPDGIVSNLKLADSAVTTDKIAFDAVTYNRMQNVATANRVLGSTSAGGQVSEVQVNQAMLQSAVTLVIYNSAGSAVKTLYGAGA